MVLAEAMRAVIIVMISASCSLGSSKVVVRVLWLEVCEFVVTKQSHTLLQQRRAQQQ